MNLAQLSVHQVIPFAYRNYMHMCSEKLASSIVSTDTKYKIATMHSLKREEYS